MTTEEIIEFAVMLGLALVIGAVWEKATRRWGHEACVILSAPLIAGLVMGLIMFVWVTVAARSVREGVRTVLYAPAILVFSLPSCATCFICRWCWISRKRGSK
jgi:hypothetical protein